MPGQNLSAGLTCRQPVLGAAAHTHGVFLKEGTRRVIPQPGIPFSGPARHRFRNGLAKYCKPGVSGPLITRARPGRAILDYLGGKPRSIAAATTPDSEGLQPVS